MMPDWDEYQKQIFATVGQPEVVRSYPVLSEAGAKTGKIDPKTRELIRLGVAVTSQGDGCITIHTDAAIKYGAAKEEIVETLGVAISIND